MAGPTIQDRAYVVVVDCDQIWLNCISSFSVYEHRNPVDLTADHPVVHETYFATSQSHLSAATSM